jgi:membrane-associated phospholipid phosphatase
MTRLIYSGLISLLFLVSVPAAYSQPRQLQLIDQSINALNEVLIHDITSPPVASRTYAYSLIAFYEASRHSNKTAKGYSGILNGLEKLVAPAIDEKYDFTVSGLVAFNTAARALVFSKEMFDEQWKPIAALINSIKIDDSVRERSVTFGKKLGNEIIEWSRQDKYAATRGLSKYTSSRAAGSWQQTAPDYMEAIEPYWNQLRPMVLSRPDQFLISPPCAFQSEKFMKDCREVYDIGLKLTKEQKNIADFWDCNPFATQTVGHMMYSVKKISPAGHWIGITGVANRKIKQDFVSALKIYSLVSIAIYDAIICAWDEKYRSNYIRPVTAIHQFYSPTWQPHLQTPPFPEYPSGHSVISNAAATVLTHFYGNSFKFVDDVEKPYGLPARSFPSFIYAAEEAAISRLFGGIHFREAIENGKTMGRNVGMMVIEKCQLEK